MAESKGVPNYENFEPRLIYSRFRADFRPITLAISPLEPS